MSQVTPHSPYVTSRLIVTVKPSLAQATPHSSYVPRGLLQVPGVVQGLIKLLGEGSSSGSLGTAFSNFFHLRSTSFHSGLPNTFG